MASSILSPSSPILPNTALFFALFPALAGIGTLVQPAVVLGFLDVKAPTAPAERKLAFSLTRLFGIRDLYLAATTATAWYVGDRWMLGVLCLWASAVVTGDGFVQKSQTGGGEWKHWSFVPVMAAVGAGLMGWLDRFAF